MEEAEINPAVEDDIKPYKRQWRLNRRSKNRSSGPRAPAKVFAEPRDEAVSNATSSTEPSKPSLDFAKLKLASHAPLQEMEKRQACPTCSKSRKYFCYDCLLPFCVVPIVENLPITFHVVRHYMEHKSKSSALPLKMLAPDYIVNHTYPQDSYDFDPENTIFLYPGEGALPVKEVDWQQYTNVVVADCTWMQSQPMTRHKSLASLPCVKLSGRKTAFWRHQQIGEQYLSSVEAMYFLLLERFECVEGQQQEYDGRYDNLLWLFSFLHKTITQAYHEQGKAFPRKEHWLQPKDYHEKQGQGE